jgi:predicted Abi (CAAX) family protease
MADVSNVVIPVFIGGAVNTIAKIKESGVVDSINVVFANVALLASMAAVGQFVDWEFAALLAVLYLIATMLTTGLPVINWVSKLVEG